jgi:hypothetical protein
VFSERRVARKPDTVSAAAAGVAEALPELQLWRTSKPDRLEPFVFLPEQVLCPILRHTSRARLKPGAIHNRRGSASKAPRFSPYRLRSPNLPGFMVSSPDREYAIPPRVIHSSTPNRRPYGPAVLLQPDVQPPTLPVSSHRPATIPTSGSATRGVRFLPR